MALTVSDTARVLVVNDDSLELTTMANSLRMQGIHVAGEAHNMLSAENLYHSLKPEIFLIDMQHAVDEALNLLQRCRKLDPQLGIVLMTSCPDLRLFGISEKNLPKGCTVILKRNISDIGIIAEAIRTSRDSAKDGEKAVWQGLMNTELDRTLSEFTDVQIETLRLVAQGLTNSEIARVRYVSEKSVEQAVARIAGHMRLTPDKSHNLRVAITSQYFRWLGSSLK